MEISEYQQKTIEISHVGSFDVLTNNSQKSISAEELGNLRDSIKKQLLTGSPEKPLTDWSLRGSNAVDNEEDPHYLAKTKQRHRNTRQFKNAKLREKNDPRHEYWRKATNAGMSISSELSLSSKVLGIVGSEDFQQVAKEMGSESIEFVEPLVGFIDRTTREKTIVYKYVHGRSLYHLMTEMDYDHRQEIILAVAKMRAIFEAGGIEPSDFCDMQILKSKEENEKNKLYLIDTEFYFKKDSESAI